MSKTYDIFLSYAHQDKDAVAPLRDALRAAGLEVWFDESAVENFSAVSRTVGDGLSVSKALLAFYSRTYPTRRACQWELTAAYVAAQRLGEPSRRILVVNPEPGSRDHIQPTTLRDTLLPPFPDPADADALRVLAESVRERVAALEGTLGDVGPMVAPRWHPIAAIQSPRFVGRVPDLWAIHSTLHAAEYPLTTGQHTRVVFVSGFGGIGKTLLAEEYALRFGAAYPGGVFWLRAFGGDPERAELGPEMREAERDRQIREVARSLDLTVEDVPLTQVRGIVAGELQRGGRPALWVIDDLPEGLSSDDVRGWLAPHPFAATLVTTRSREYSGLGTVLQPGVLPPDEAYELLTFQRKPSDTAEEESARDIVAELGSHALAVEIAGAALHDSRDRSFTEFLAELRDPSYDELALAAELAPALPTERKEGIAAMLARSIAGLSPTARGVLVIASMLPPSPIPDGILTDTLARIDERSAAKHRARMALAETDRRSLTERVGNDARTVHPLLVRALRFATDVDDVQTSKVREALVASVYREVSRLNALPVAQGDTIIHPHARALVQKIETNGEAGLAQALADHADRNGLYATGAEIWDKIVEYARFTWGNEASETLLCMNNLAVSLSKSGDLTGSRMLIEEIVSTQLQLYGEENPITIGSISNLALLLHEQGQYKEARTLNEKVLGIRQRIFGEEHPDTLMSMNNLAMNLGALEDKAGARALDEKVLEIRRRVLGETAPTTLTSMINLAVSYAEEGDITRARALEEKVLELSRRINGEDHPLTLTVMSNLANRFLEIGNTTEAKALHEYVMEARLRVLGNMHPATLISMYTLGLLEVDAGNWRRGLELAKAALAGQLQVLGEDHPDTARTQSLVNELARLFA